MALELNLRKKPATSSSSTTSSTTTKSSSTSGSTKKNSIKEFSFYKDDKKMSAKESFSYLRKSSLFGKDDLCEYGGRMVNASQKLLTNDKWQVNMDADGDGTKEDVNLADAIADSFDSELDLYIQSEFEKNN